MQPRIFLIIASLAANLALVAALAFRSEPAATSASSSTTATQPTATASPVTAVVHPPTASLWSVLQTEDLDDFSRRLRAAGFPAITVRMLISQKIQERLQADRDALLGSLEEVPYWKAGYGSVLSADQQERLRDLFRESRELTYKYLSGPEALAEDEAAQAGARRRYGNLSLEKLQQLTALDHDMQELRDKALAAAKPGADPGARWAASRETMQALEVEQKAQLAKILTPDELEQYDLRTNSGFLAQQLAAFKPTEEEFKAIYAAQKSLRTAPADPNMTPAQRQDEYEARLATALGPERALDYLEVSKAGSSGLPLLVARLNLPLSAIGSVNAVKDDISRRAAATHDDPSLTSAQRQAQLTALAQEANQKLASALGGQRGLEAYLDFKGDWVRSLQPPHK